MLDRGKPVISYLKTTRDDQPCGIGFVVSKPNAGLRLHRNDIFVRKWADERNV